MAYQKHTWSAGENITASKLNNIENGIKNNDNVLVIKFEVTETIENQSSVFTVASTPQYLAEKYNQAIAAIADDKFVIAKIEVTTAGSNEKDIRYLPFIKMTTGSSESEQSIFFSEVHISTYTSGYNQQVIQTNTSEFVLYNSYSDSQGTLVNNSSYQKTQR